MNAPLNLRAARPQLRRRVARAVPIAAALLGAATAGAAAAEPPPAAADPPPACPSSYGIRFVHLPDRLMAGRRHGLVRVRAGGSTYGWRITGVFVARQGDRIVDRVWPDGRRPLHAPNLFLNERGPLTLDARLTLHGATERRPGPPRTCRLHLRRTIPVYMGERPIPLVVKPNSGVSAHFSFAPADPLRCALVRAPGPLVLRARPEGAVRWLTFYAGDRCDGDFWYQPDAAVRWLSYAWEAGGLRLTVTPPEGLPRAGREVVQRAVYRIHRGRWTGRHGGLDAAEVLQRGELVTTTRRTRARGERPGHAVTTTRVSCPEPLAVCDLEPPPPDSRTWTPVTGTGSPRQAGDGSDAPGVSRSRPR